MATRCLRMKNIQKQKGARRLDQIFDGWNRRISRFGLAFLAGEFYWGEDWRPISLWHVRDQCDGFFSGRHDSCRVGHKSALESELAISDPDRFHWGIYDVFHF